MPDKETIPKGEMCMHCAHLKEDCSKLPFNTYPKIETDIKFIVVRCKEFKRAD